MPQLRFTLKPKKFSTSEKARLNRKMERKESWNLCMFKHNMYEVARNFIDKS